MDPLSLTLGALSLVGVCHKIVNGLQVLQSLSQIPDDIASLIDELSDLEQVLTIVCNLRNRVQTKEERQRTDELKALLLKASSIVVAVARHCGISLEGDQHCTESSTSKIDLLTKFRWLKDQKKIIQFRQRLKVVRLDISNHLASQNLQNTYSILAEVRDLAEVCRRLSIEKETECIQKAIMAIDVQPPVDSSISGPPAYTQRAITTMSSCSCACHRVKTFATPRSSEKWIGHLQIRSGGLWTPSCDQVLCRQSKHALLQTSYRLPSWLADQVWNTRFATNLAGPDLNLFSSRVISRNSEIFHCAIEGNLAGVKKLFSDGKASPCDVTHNYGYSALHYAVDYGHLDLCKFLIKAGAKVELQDFDNRTPTDIAYRKLMSNEIEDRVQEVFDQEEWLEQRQLTMLHKIVLGLSDRTLEDELSASVSEINVGDCDQRTPLSWAAELGKEDAVRALRKFGADHRADRDGNTPVHYACKTTAGPGVLKFMMNTGADPLVRNKWQQTPMNWVSFSQDDPAYASALLFHPEVRVSLSTDNDQFGSTPVGNAAFSGNAVMLKFLLDNGADPNAGIGNGEVPLLDSISRNSYECVRILLCRDLNMSQPDGNNETVLHYLARRANVKTINIVMEAINTGRVDVFGLRTADVGKEGLTPRNILTLRGDEEVQVALDKILAVIDQEVEASSASYEDAFEILEDLEKDLGWKAPLVRVSEIVV